MLKNLYPDCRVMKDSEEAWADPDSLPALDQPTGGATDPYIEPPDHG